MLVYSQLYDKHHSLNPHFTMIDINPIPISDSFHFFLLSAFFLFRHSCAGHFHINGIMQCIVTSGWLVSLGIMFSRSLHAVLFSLFHCLGAWHFIYVLILGRHLHFPILTIMYYAPGSGIVESPDKFVVCLCRTSHIFSKWAMLFSMLTINIWGGGVAFLHPC